MRSLIARRFSRHLALTPEEIARLETLEAHPVAVARHRTIRKEDERSRHAYVLQSGWAMSSMLLADGSRQILRLHLPGDIMAMPSVALRREVEKIEALTDCIIAPFDKNVLQSLFTDFPRLAATMFLFAQVERLAYGERLASVARTSAKARIAFLLIDILERLRASDPGIGDSFEMPLTQEQIGDLTGQTAIHANRMWQALVEDGLVARRGDIFTIPAETRLRALAQYVNRFDDLDFSWLPEPQGPTPAMANAG